MPTDAAFDIQLSLALSVRLPASALYICSALRTS